MSPTIFRAGGFRYFFFSREETRIHIHVSLPDGAAKFWIEPDVDLASASGLSAQQLREAERFVRYLAFADFPWFAGASMDQLSDIQWPSADHLYWLALDIDLSVASIRDPAAFPLVAVARKSA